jgi:hypothetical protein
MHNPAPLKLHHFQRVRCPWTLLACPRCERLVELEAFHVYSFLPSLAEEPSKNEEAFQDKEGVKYSPTPGTV